MESPADDVATTKAELAALRAERREAAREFARLGMRVKTGAASGEEAAYYYSLMEARILEVNSQLAERTSMEQTPEPPVTESNEPAQESLSRLQTLLGQITFLSTEIDRLQGETQEVVAEARELGATWAEIADIAGIKPQSAYQRWSDTGREKHLEYQREYQRKRQPTEPSE